MATRTIANGGGNFQSTGTWVEGAIPTSADDVVATASSGQLTVDSASQCKTFIMTNYVNTLTMNATLTVAGTVTFVSGMTIAGTSDLICNTTATLTSGGKTLTGGLQLLGTSQTFTMSGTWTVNGTLAFSGTTLTTFSGTINSAGGLTGSVATISGGTINLTGGTFNATSLFKCTIAFAGNPTITNTMTVGTATINYTSGTPIMTGSTLSFFSNQNSTVNTSGMTWNNITCNGTQTITINSLLNVSGTLTLSNGATSFAGTAGFSVANLFTPSISAARTYTFKSSIIYTVTTSMILYNGVNATNTISFVASTPGTKALLNLQVGATQALVYVNPTDIDSSGGQPIYSALGTITTSTNWTTTPSGGGTKRRVA